MGADEIALADTIGVAVPSDVQRLLELVQTRGRRYALTHAFSQYAEYGYRYVYAAVEAGVRIFDASCGGLGGCPFAPNATGNIGTEDVLYLIHRMGLETGVDVEKVIETSKWLEGPLEAPMPAMITRAGLFPTAA